MDLYPIYSNTSGFVRSIDPNPGTQVSTNDRLIEITSDEDEFNLKQITNNISQHQELHSLSFGQFKDAKTTTLREAVDVTKKYVEYLNDIYTKAAAARAAGNLPEEINFYQLKAEKQEAENNLAKARRNLTNFNLETVYDEKLSASKLETIKKDKELFEKRAANNKKYNAPFTGLFYPAVLVNQYISVGTVLYYLKPT